MSMRSLTCSLLTVLCCVFAWTCKSDTAPPIVKDGKANAQILTSEKPTRTVKLAAEELRDAIRKISGAELPILTKPSNSYPVRIYVGKSIYTDSLGISSEGFKNDSYRIASGKDYLAFVGDDADFVPIEPYPHNDGDMERVTKEWDKLTDGCCIPIGQLQTRNYNKLLDINGFDGFGTLNGVYEFLRSLGVRWYFPGEFGECMPAQKMIALPKLDKTVNPDFAQRVIGGQSYTLSKIDRDQALWLVRLGLGSPKNISAAGHGINNVIHKDYTRKNHPDWYRMINGKRETTQPKDGQPCLSAKGLVQSMIVYVRASFDVYKLDFSNVSPTDGYISICQCDMCKGKDTPERGFNGSMSDYVWAYVNEIAKELYKTHPDKEVNCSAYTTYLAPPLKIEKLPPNVTAMIQQNRYKFGDPDQRKWILDLRKGWLEKLPGKNPLTLHDNYSSSGNSPFPMYYPHLIAEDIRSLKGVCRGEYVEENSSKSKDPKPAVKLAVNHLNIYVTSRLWWDAEQDVDALLDDYYVKFYGPASKEMKAFIGFCEANWKNMDKDAALIDKALELMASASKTAGKESIYAKRVALVDEYLSALRQIRDKVAVGRKNNPVAVAVDLSGTKDEITLDGKIDEGIWKNARAYHLHVAKTGEKPAFDTWFKTVWKDDRLYFGIYCQEDDTKKLNIGTTKNEDTAIWNGDAVEIMLETQNHPFYQISVNPSGAMVDMDQKFKNNTKWNSDAKLAVDVGTDHWSVEICIPVADEMQEENLPDQLVSGRKPVKDAPWYFNVGRSRIRETGSESAMFALPGGKRGFRTIEDFGQLYLEK